MVAGVPLTIPTQPRAQRFTISLNDITYGVRVKWNGASNCWVMDLYDSSDVLMRGGVPLVTGADLLEQFEYLGVGGAMIVQSDDNVDAVPTFENLGTVGHLYFVPSS